jgi:hypothetical protein
MIEKKILRSGQARRYQDSVYEYEIKSDEGFDKTKEHCLSVVCKCNVENEKKDYIHDGSCGFPFGLDSFYTFTDQGKGVYRYTVTHPFCD